MQDPVYVALSSVASALHYLLYAVTGPVHVNDQLVSLQFLVIVFVGIQLSLQVIMRVSVTLGKNLTYQVEGIRCLPVRKELVVCVQLVMQRYDADAHLGAILDEKYHVVEVAERIVK